MRNSHAPVILGVLLLGVASATNHEVAHADTQAVADAIYADAKSIIEELITRDIAHNLAPNLACRAPSVAAAYGGSIQRIYDRQFGTLRASLMDETTDLVAYEIFQTLEGAQAAPGRNAIKYEPPAVLPALPRVVATCVDTLRDNILKEHGLKNTTGPFLDGVCKAAVSLPSRELSCSVALAARAYLQGRDDVGKERIIRAIAAVVAQRVVAVAALQGSPIDVELPKMEEFIVLTREFLGNEKPTTQALMDEFEEHLADLVQTSPADHGRVLAAIKSIATALQRVRTQWTLLTSDGKADFDTLVAVVASVGGALGDLCDDAVMKTTAACKAVGNATKLTDTPSLAPLMTALARRDYREIATIAIGELFPLFSESAGQCQSKTIAKRDLTAAANPVVEPKEVIDEPDPNKPDCRKFELYRRFAINAAVYVLEAAQQGQPSDGSRAAFKDAALDVIEELNATPGGFDRPPMEKVFVPDFALRYSWSESYLNEAGANGVRLVPSINWLNFRIRVRYTDYTYFAIKASAIDFLAPFTEIAVRKKPNDGYSYPHAPWTQFLYLRLDGEFGVPALTKSVALVIGVGLRPAVAYTLADGTHTYTYFWNNTTGETPHDYITRFFDFNIGLRYVL